MERGRTTDHARAVTSRGEGCDEWRSNVDCGSLELTQAPPRPQHAGQQNNQPGAEPHGISEMENNPFSVMGPLESLPWCMLLLEVMLVSMIHAAAGACAGVCGPYCPTPGQVVTRGHVDICGHRCRLRWQVTTEGHFDVCGSC